MKLLPFFSICRFQAASFAQQKQSSNATEKKRSRRILLQTFSSWIALIRGYYVFLPGNFFLNISNKNFSEHSGRLALVEISVRSDSECLGNNNSV